MTFTRCSIASVIYSRNTTLYNNPVNLTNCFFFYKSKYAEYPDNRGKPTIRFVFGVERTDWTFDTEEDRDKEFESLCHL
jgi:hypothetical protein